MGRGGNVLLLPYFEVEISYERLPSLSPSISSNMLRGMSSKSATSKGCDRWVAGSPGQGAKAEEPRPRLYALIKGGSLGLKHRLNMSRGSSLGSRPGIVGQDFALVRYITTSFCARPSKSHLVPVLRRAAGRR